MSPLTLVITSISSCRTLRFHESLSRGCITTAFPSPVGRGGGDIIARRIALRGSILRFALNAMRHAFDHPAFTSILFGFAFSALGNTNLRTPSFIEALILL